MDRSPQPGLIGLDWGTSSLRAYLHAPDGAVVERRAEPWGIQYLPHGGYAAAFRGVAGDWRDRWPEVPVLAAGMVGSRQGWREVPYVDCPADPATIAAGIVEFATDCGTLHIAPGIAQTGASPDVMRGEETQIVGAIVREPALAADSLLVLPGTHCKWARIRNGRVVRFTTYLTGELFAMLRDHSIIGRPAREARVAGAAGPGSAAFLRGVGTARDSGAEGIAGKLFTTRSLYLAGDVPVADTLDYLSGLLVGEEIRSVLAGLGGACPPCVLLGEAGLCSRYREALAAFGVGQARALDETGPAGLWHIAVAAGLVPHSNAAPLEHSGRG
ncbi:MAG: 2-dehydro-3-deoxygalactonokinase [Planctomycetia bacterium]